LVWGLIIACFLFSVDFYIRFEFFSIIKSEFIEVISEVFRAVSILLISIFGHYGHMIPPAKSREEIPGTQRLNNLFFALIAFFPVMIFYTIFWQVNLNDRKMQQKEIQLSKEVFLISTKMIEERVEGYSRIMKELQGSTSLATAQWKLKTFLFTDPEIEIAQLVTSYPITYKDEEVIFEKGRVTFYNRSEQGWGIKLSVNMETVYKQFPLNDSQQLYAFLDNTTFVYPPGKSKEYSMLFTGLSDRDYVYKNSLTLFDKPFETYLVFSTSPTSINVVTLSFLLGTVFVMVLIWWFYGFYIHQWEKKAREKMISLNQAKEEYGEQVGRLESLLKLVSGDLELTTDKLGQFSRTVYQLTDSFSNFDFQKGPSFELKQLYDKLLSIMSWVENIIFFQKGTAKGKVLAFSGSEPAYKELPPTVLNTSKESWVGPFSLTTTHSVTEDSGTPSRNPSLSSDPKTVFIDKHDLLLAVFLKDRSYEPSNYELHFLHTLFNISELYIKIFYSTKRNDTFSQKYMLLSRFQLNLLPLLCGRYDPRTQKNTVRNDLPPILTDMLLKFLKKIYPDAALVGLITSENDDSHDLTLVSIKEESPTKRESEESFVSESEVLSEETYPKIEEFVSGKPLMGEIRESKGLIPGAHSRILLPLLIRNRQKASLIIEFTYFKVFSNNEKEYLFFLSQIIGELLDLGR
jgi:hypothetical protein